MGLRTLQADDLRQLSVWMKNADDIARYMRAPAFWGLVATEGDLYKGVIIGWCYEDEVEVIDILVHPDYRRSGIGTMLLDGFIRLAKAAICRLEVRIDNVPAVKFYEKFGFIQDGIRADYYRDAAGFCDAVLMTYRLNTAEEN